ncbi:rCG38803 [Rattus norvegicus]|uniref:RCG38803 n=1 Tax=Rattus norvegicus TaxID=10116 RepID=A6KA18_RAT|nr:rCG38803 [Rattus norvegicus]
MTGCSHTPALCLPQYPQTRGLYWGERQEEICPWVSFQSGVETLCGNINSSGQKDQKYP